MPAPLPSLFWRAKFPCRQSCQYHAKVLIRFLFPSFWGAFLTLKRFFSLSSGKSQLLGGGEMRALPPQFGDPLAGVEIGPVDERKVGDLTRVVGAVGDADLLAGDGDSADRK